ncbi:hypothetical protein CDL12_05059 [Handroanthus impetiginosus]|uniref:Uncharacterized protein n=1 Tax=Handroanthus impetiginosus TaxID=429701 RepID=A0A2G9HXI9_9LAMI|nr:hypothetical protein CDL12_05059 [Handroanthus impetiginosus]
MASQENVPSLEQTRKRRRPPKNHQDRSGAASTARLALVANVNQALQTNQSNLANPLGAGGLATKQIFAMWHQFLQYCQ